MLAAAAARSPAGDRRRHEVFGQPLVPPPGSAGTRAEFVAVTEDAALTRRPPGIGAAVAAALRTYQGPMPRLAVLIAPT